MRKGIDVSRWNYIDDYAALKHAGVEFAIVKVNNSGYVADSKFHEHMAGFKNVGIPVIGGYNYSYANTLAKAKKAADSFVNLAQPYGIDFMWLDLEDVSMRGLGSKILDIIDVYQKIAVQAGMWFGIYTGASFFNPCLKKYESELQGIPFWWARYPSVADRAITDDVPSSQNLPTGLDLDGWQYSSKGVINGATGYLDLNVWYETAPFVNTDTEIPVEYNPFTEPSRNVMLGTIGNDANWVLWYLWRFGKLVDANGNADSIQIDGLIDSNNVVQIKEVQALLGLDADGIVGKCTRAVWKKIC